MRPSLRPRTKLVDRGSDHVWSNDGRHIFLVEVATGTITELASLGVAPSW